MKDKDIYTGAGDALFWRTRYTNLVEISEKQSKALAEALKIKNDALDLNASQSNIIVNLQQELATTKAELHHLSPKPKFKVGQVVRLTGSGGGFHGYHKITGWSRHENCSPGDRIRYSFEPGIGLGSTCRYDGTGEQYLIAVTPEEIR